MPVGRVFNSSFINTYYAVVPVYVTGSSDFLPVRCKHLAVVTEILSSIEFGVDGWTVIYPADFGWWDVENFLSYGKYTNLSVLVVSPTEDVNVTFNIPDDEGTFQIRGLNLSVRPEVASDYRQALLAEPNVSVIFDPLWDQVVSNTPEIILEAGNITSISVYQQPKKVSIKTASFYESANGGSKPDGKPSGQNPEGDGPNTGLIIGIVVAVVVVVAIVVGLVVFLMKKKEKVHPAESSEEGTIPQATSAQEERGPPPQAYQQQESQYQPPPPQCQYQQPPSQWQYQPPPSQWQYQPPPPQWQYQQPPEHSGKHKHKHSTKKDKTKKPKNEE